MSYILFVSIALRLISSPNFDLQNLIFILILIFLFYLLSAEPNLHKKFVIPN